MTMSVIVTSAAIRTVRPMMAGIGASNNALKLVSDNVCCRLFVKGLTVQKAVISITTSDAM